MGLQLGSSRNRAQGEGAGCESKNHMGVSYEKPQNGWFTIMENPIKMDDLGVPLF